MAFFQASQGPELRTITTKPDPNHLITAHFQRSLLKQPNDRQINNEEDLQSSFSPSLSYGSSRTSSICSIPDPPASGPPHRNSSIKLQCPLNMTEVESINIWERTESPGPIQHSAIPSRLRYTASHLVYPTYENVKSHAHQHLQFTASSDSPMSLAQEPSQSRLSTPSQCQVDSPPSRALHLERTENEAMKKASANPETDSEATDSGSDSGNDSDDSVSNDDDNWSGSNDYVEAAIFQAAYPDRELAAYLITRMYGTLALGSSKKITRQISLWQDRVTTCANDSGTASTQTTTTQKAVDPNTSSGTPIIVSLKRDRLTGSAGNNMGEEDDEEDDDNEDNLRKRVKENNHGDGPMVQLACPFYKMDPAKYDAQNNKEGSKQSRACRGPGYRTIQQLKEHIKRIHYPVQCDRCHLIFKYKGSDRPSAVVKLIEHRQLDEPCLKKPPSMREGISDAQWSKLSEVKQSRKARAFAAETPKSNLEKWMDIWTVLFPGQNPPKTPWCDAAPGDTTASSPFQGVHHFLEVAATALENKLPTIRAAAVSATDEELINMLLDISKLGFQVWSNTVRWSDNSTSSHSNSHGSGSLSFTSWEHVSKQTSSSRQMSPNMQSGSAYLEVGIGSQNHRPGVVHSSTGHGGINETSEKVLPSNQYPQPNISTTPQSTVPSTASFDLDAELQASGFSGYPGDQFSSDLAGMQNPDWGHPLDQMQFENSFNMAGTQSQVIPEVVPTQWNDQQYAPQPFHGYTRRP